jgi:hypothetical protein
MSDIFISYARPDEPQAKRVAEALRSLGYSVWRDDPRFDRMLSSAAEGVGLDPAAIPATATSAPLRS